jgi:ubiquinone/menaquinone biosynthesis C-methylase UbiE
MHTENPFQVRLDEKYWKDLKDKSAAAGITLDEKISLEDFVIYGERIAQRQLAMFEKVGGAPFESSSILEIGCGIGRLLRPFSRRFKRAVGVDLNDRILGAAQAFLGDCKNVELMQNDGVSIPFPDNSFDYAFCGGVLQHIPDIEVITGYFYEGLRVLKPGGTLNYSIMVWMTSRIGGVEADRVGAKIVAADIDRIINDTGHNLAAIFCDLYDPLPHFQILIRKASRPAAAMRWVKRRLKPIHIGPSHITPMNVRTGAFEDLPSYDRLRALWSAGKRRPVTFFSEPE